MRKTRLVLLSLLVYCTSALADERANEVLSHYANLAHAVYSDSLALAMELQGAVNNLVETPNEENLAAAREAWVAARVPYQQSEVYRFGNAIVDDWEGKVNAWPLDEGLIDYVDASYGDASEENPAYVVNVVNNSTFMFSGSEVDAQEITPDLLESLHELGGVEANVSTGYHAIEFLLWGQDLNGTGPGAGNRPASDFDTENCSAANCERRVAYLQAATELLITDLQWIIEQWTPDGEATASLTVNSVEEGLSTILTGMGSLSYGELAGERMQLGLLLHDPEEEHDCFSDNTHASHYYDALGVRNIYLGEYERIDGSVLKGAGISELVKSASADTDAELRSLLDATMEKMSALMSSAEQNERYDQLIGEGNESGNALVQAAIDALTMQTKGIELAVAALGLDTIAFEGSDSLDNPEAVFE